MGKKSRLKAIKRLADSLPTIKENTLEKRVYTGAEILAWKTVKEIDGKPINPEQKYIFNYPVINVQNNQRRMKRAYLRNGVEGIKSIYDKTINTIDANINPSKKAV